MFCPREGAVDQGAARGALSLLRRTVSLLVGEFGRRQKHLPVILMANFDQVSGFGEPEEKSSLRHFAYTRLFGDPARAQACNP
jgi:hypothetical protein